MHAIEIDNVRKTFGRGRNAVEALKGVSLRVSPGEIYGLLGRNGAGKTTMVKILLDIVRPSEGKARILGLPSRSAATRRKVGYLPEDHRFPDYRTGHGALAFYARLSGVPRETYEPRVPELLEMAGLKDAGRRKIRTYSKGMKQRLGLAQAMVHDPDVLFLDEPTDGIDPVGRSEIRDALQALKAKEKTIFLNSHLLSEVEMISDRVGILEQGALVREGTVEDLTKCGCFYLIGAVPRPDAGVVGEMRKLAVSVQERPEGLEVGLVRPEGIDPIVDLLRARGIGVRSLTSKRMTLEEVFIEAVQEVGKQRPEEAGQTK
jgi:ABC-2 type transport system ATP-binding protein